MKGRVTKIVKWLFYLTKKKTPSSQTVDHLKEINKMKEVDPLDEASIHSVPANYG